MTSIGRLLRDEGAQGVVEYAMIAGFLILVVLVATRMLGTSANSQLSTLASQMS
jgi:Flp pilus assembly pilin Flp